MVLISPHSLRPNITTSSIPYLSASVSGLELPSKGADFICWCWYSVAGYPGWLGITLIELLGFLFEVILMMLPPPDAFIDYFSEGPKLIRFLTSFSISLTVLLSLSGLDGILFSAGASKSGIVGGTGVEKTSYCLTSFLIVFGFFTSLFGVVLTDID